MKAFDQNRFHGSLVRGDVTEAYRYLSQFPEQAELYRKYICVFEREEYPAMTADGELSALLLVYQRYYRDVWAADRIAQGFAAARGDGNLSIPEIQAAARALFAESSAAMRKKYGDPAESP